MYEGPAPAKWQRVRTSEGYHLRLVGANGEPVMWTENYPDPRTVQEALVVALRAVDAYSRPSVTAAATMAQALIEDVDERGSD